MKPISLFCAGFCFLLHLQCLSLFTIRDNLDQVKPDRKIVYSGIRNFPERTFSDPRMQPLWRYDRSIPFFALYFLILDPLLSLASDTVLLPATIPWAIYDNAKWQDTAQCLCWHDPGQRQVCTNYPACTPPDMIFEPESAAAAYNRCANAQRKEHGALFCHIEHRSN